LTDFDESWHDDAHWPLIYSGLTDKNVEFLIIKMAAILKITKIAISPQRFDRSLRNLVR